MRQAAQYAALSGYFDAEPSHALLVIVTAFLYCSLHLRDVVPRLPMKLSDVAMIPCRLHSTMLLFDAFQDARQFMQMIVDRLVCDCHVLYSFS